MNVRNFECLYEDDFAEDDDGLSTVILCSDCYDSETVKEIYPNLDSQGQSYRACHTCGSPYNNK